MAVSDELSGWWVRLSESPSELILGRRGLTKAPVSRKPMAIEFRDDGTFIEATSGPADRIEPAGGRWAAVDEGLRLVYTDDRPDRVFKVATAEGRLVLTKV
ncbi:MAG TPA: hypothetical protein VKB93_28385 [Thermoanaerobaculia bacterium]|nr:hypothetical protein [Thermoanaerobaculia bacterium]